MSKRLISFLISMFIVFAGCEKTQSVDSTAPVTSSSAQVGAAGSGGSAGAGGNGGAGGLATLFRGVRKHPFG